MTIMLTPVELAPGYDNTTISDACTTAPTDTLEFSGKTGVFLGVVTGANAITLMITEGANAPYPMDIYPDRMSLVGPFTAYGITTITVDNPADVLVGLFLV